MIGRKAGEQVSFEETYGNDHSDRYLRGQTVHFSCTIKEVRESVVPAIDDEFAKLAGRKDLASLKEAIGKEWDRGNSENASRQKKIQVRKLVVQSNPLPVDEAELKRYCDSAASEHGISYDDLLKTPETAKLAESIREDQREVITYNQILDRVFDLHSKELILNEQDIIRYAAEDTQPGVTPEEELRAKRSKPSVYASWLQRSQRQKVADWLCDSAVVIKKPLTSEV